MGTIRVSMACMVRTLDKDGRLLLLASEKTNRLSIIGGGLHHEPAGKQFLTDQLGAHDFENPDLRFQVDEAALPAVEAWFRRRTDRELTPWRELVEEMVDATTDGHPVLSLSQAKSLMHRRPPLYTLAYHSTSNRSGIPRRTFYLTEVTEVTASHGVQKQCCDNKWVYWATAEEILAGTTQYGTEIAGVATALLGIAPQRY